MYLNEHPRQLRTSGDWREEVEENRAERRVYEHQKLLGKSSASGDWIALELGAVRLGLLRR
jgi:hypothetical protein